MNLVKMAAVSTLVLIGACQSIEKVELPPLLPIADGAANGSEETQQAATTHAGLRVISGPQLPSYDVAIQQTRNETTPTLGEKSVQVNVDGLSLPAFINEVFGNTLGLNFSMEAGLSKRSDQVTLRATEPQSAEQIYHLAVQVLNQYGVSVEQQANALYFYTVPGNGKQPPLLVSGRTLPDVPSNHRPLFQVITLKAVRVGDVRGWITKIFGSALSVEIDQKRNSVILQGPPNLVAQGLRAVQTLDQPFMRGRLSRIVEPTFVGADELAERLVEVLSAEGYGATTSLQVGGSIIVLPAQDANQIVMFAADQALLTHAERWLEKLDKPEESSGERFFFYTVQNTTASGILETIEKLSGRNTEAETGQEVVQMLGGRSGLVFDEPRNMLIFNGTASKWQQWLSLIRELDQPPKQVLIEVTIAEVTLNEQENFGVEWFASGSQSTYGEAFTSLPVDSVGGSGLTAIVLDSVGQAKVTLNAFASDSRVQLLSTPRIVVQSGATANIDIGTEVPIITSQAEPTDSDGRITQSIQYRRTGIILNVSPVVHSGNRVDLEITQEVSEALPISAGASIQSPSIFNRKVDTVLSLANGGSVILGGLLSTRSTVSDSGTPFLKDIPFLGAAFRANDHTHDRTEMIMLIIPYVIESDATARALTQSLGKQLDWLEESL
jgi:general secretion pathway protein D